MDKIIQWLDEQMREMLNPKDPAATRERLELFSRIRRNLSEARYLDKQKRFHYIQAESGSIISGEATTNNVGRGEIRGFPAVGHYEALIHAQYLAESGELEELTTFLSGMDLKEPK